MRRNRISLIIAIMVFVGLPLVIVIQLTGLWEVLLEYWKLTKDFMGPVYKPLIEIVGPWLVVQVILGVLWVIMTLKYN
jgi:hypothetical protein